MPVKGKNASIRGYKMSLPENQVVTVGFYFAGGREWVA
jgi:hypothetical protein